MEKLTDTQIRALTILKDTDLFSGVPARWFGEIMWKDHVMHKRVMNGGNGAQVGKGGWLFAGSYLAKLKKKGLVQSTPRGLYYISYKGKELLKAHTG